MAAESRRTRYVLRRTARAFMIDKQELDRDVWPDDEVYITVRSFGWFRSRESARRFMLKHGGRP